MLFRSVVAFQVMKTRDSSDVAVEDRVKAAVDKLAQKQAGVSFVKIFSTVDETRASFAATEHTLLEGMLLASLVVLLPPALFTQYRRLHQSLRLHLESRLRVTQSLRLVALASARPSCNQQESQFVGLQSTLTTLQSLTCCIQ